MQIVILSGLGGKRWRFGETAISSFLVLIVMAVFAAFWLGYGHAARHSNDHSVVPDLRHTVALLEQQHELNRAVSNAAAQLEALSARTASLHARTTQLDALGRQLVALGGLDAGEFLFDRPALPQQLLPVGQAEEQLVGALRRLEALLADREPKLASLEHALLMQRLHRRTTPSGRPVHKGWISSTFGPRLDPVTGSRAFHDGIDIAGRYKSPVIAVAAGVVTLAGRVRGYGNIVQIEHGSGLATRYAHNQKNLAKVGDTVGKGEIIALMGSTGRSTGSHVHFEIWRHGKAIDPKPFL